MTIRRMDLLPFLVGGGVILIFPIAVAANQPSPWLPVGLLGCAAALVVVFAYLDGPAVTFTVDPARVVVGNTFVRYEVPRSRITGFATAEYLSLRMVLDDGRKISVRVWEPAMLSVSSIRPGTADARMRPVVELVERTPAGPGPGGPVLRRPRVGNILLATAPVAAALVLIAVS
ncbi:hypothetical protein ACPPVO_20100 [Dactylosporangium sp. McL0621]|uniref:hypothetical protein n=1 Tax=Dactylosporangium sp. McL0621 TaxID=3415678 RepID=UPI003CF652B4